MKTSSISGILLATLVVSGLGQQPTIPDKNKSEGTVDADKDRAGKTGHIGDGDRGGSDKTRYVGSERFGAFEHSQLDIDRDGRISKNEFEQALHLRVPAIAETYWRPLARQLKIASLERMDFQV